MRLASHEPDCNPQWLIRKGFKSAQNRVITHRRRIAAFAPSRHRASPERDHQDRKQTATLLAMSLRLLDLDRCERLRERVPLGCAPSQYLEPKFARLLLDRAQRAPISTLLRGVASPQAYVGHWESRSHHAGATIAMIGSRKRPVLLMTSARRLW